MRWYIPVLCTVCAIALTLPTLGAGNGKGLMSSAPPAETPPDTKGGRPSDIEGPVGDHGSIQGELYGDLYRLLRYRGDETKRVPEVDANGAPIMNSTPQPWTCPAGHTHLATQQAWDTAPATGGEPVLSEDFAAYTVSETEGDDPVLLPGPYPPTDPNADCTWWPAPYPSQCVQPIASWQRWGDISTVVDTDNPSYERLEEALYNTIPTVKTYDPTWERTEFAVGTRADPVYFIPPGSTGFDPNNGTITYTDGVLWTDLIQEVGFGRLNQARATPAVLTAAFDEAISSINSAVAIRLDPSGRLLLTKIVYDEIYVYDEPKVVELQVINVAGTGMETITLQMQSGDPLVKGLVEKAVDSPLENIALYKKMMQDGHLVTPGDERAPIDRSADGGIPLDMLLGLEDGPSTELRPTIDIQKMRYWGLGYFVDVEEVNYVTYYTRTIANGEVTDYVLHAVEYTEGTSLPPEAEDVQFWNGIPTAVESSPVEKDFEFCASALSAAADKGGKLSIDHVVYLNSMLGLNQVVGTSEDGSIDYSKNPQYFNYGTAPVYDRETVFGSRGWLALEVPASGGDPAPSFHPGEVLVLLPIDSSGFPTGDWTGSWGECSAPILTDPDQSVFGFVPFRQLGEDELTRFPDGSIAAENIAGFTQGADDNLSLIDFVHTFQIPGNR
jgi:hypothetical protein